jgi:hypothetical protein
MQAITLGERRKIAKETLGIIDCKSRWWDAFHNLWACEFDCCWCDEQRLKRCRKNKVAV